ncbi:transposase domain-containing protein, partial [Nonomuraea sp. NPDC049784]|uniref:transposase domain-containing protein n=1 Tax=Nonomuraea sp. NPDC049784 TaxID=3154361 RepID=UPI0033D5A330
MQEKSAITRTIETAAGVHAPGHLGELTQIVDFTLMDAVLEETGAREKRLRLLPARVVVYFTLALAPVRALLLPGDLGQAHRRPGPARAGVPGRLLARASATLG